jgi:hypothetical protein
MAEIVQLHARTAAEPSDHDLLMRALDEIAALRAEIDALKPVERFSIPVGWLNAPRASNRVYQATRAAGRGGPIRLPRDRFSSP